MTDRLGLAPVNFLVPVTGQEDELSQPWPPLGLAIGSHCLETCNYVPGAWRWTPE